MSKKITYILAGAMLVFMLTIAFFSMKDDSAIMDEVAHLPAGYSYIVKGDMRLNPEHPPLIKDLAGGMIWLWSKAFDQPVYFPEDIPAWQQDINGQWTFGFDFMYEEGNNADLMLLLGRLPMLLILLILGIYVFKWTRELYGKKAALLALFLYSFSPTFIAHGRFITTDVAAAAAIFIASYYFIKWLKQPGAKNLIIAGLVFGLVQLAKFSVFLLVPLFVFVALVWVCVKTREEQKNEKKFSQAFWPLILKYVGGTILLMAIGAIFVIWPVYLYHVHNYPIDRQIADAKYNLSTFGLRPVANLVIWLSEIPGLRALAQYGLGLAMVLQRADGGNTTYFLGQISNLGSPLYFPFVYLVKETLTLHILTLVALAFGIYRAIKEKLFKPAAFGSFIQRNIGAVLMISFIALYWYSSLTSPLNIGVRHVLPTFAFVFVLIAGQISQWLATRSATLKEALKTNRTLLAKYIFVGILIVWQIASVVSVYPSFLAYFNELVGMKNGYKYAVDSNLDWGQDLKRLAQWTQENNIDKIYVNYFGGATPQYHLGEKYIPWWSERDPEILNDEGGWLAVSATFLQGGRGEVIDTLSDQEGLYRWLDDFEPITVIGHSIFVYHIPPHSVIKISSK